LGLRSASFDPSSCHEPLAMDEEILKTLGIAERISNVQKQ
jgi:hypothetical protein